MGMPQSPVAGPDFLGNCSIGGAWSTTTGFPPPWQQGYFHAELRGLSLNVYFERAIQEATERDVPADHPARAEG